MNHPTIIVFYLPFHSKGQGSCQSTLRSLSTKDQGVVVKGEEAGEEKDGEFGFSRCNYYL